MGEVALLAEGGVSSATVIGELSMSCDVIVVDRFSHRVVVFE